MRSLLVVAITWLVAIGLGRALLSLVFGRKKLVPTLNPGEAAVCASAVGLGVIAYGVFALGMAGFLSKTAISIWIGIAALVGTQGMRATWADLRGCIRDRAERPSAPVGRPAARATSAALWLTLGTLAIVAAAACYQPPGPHAWDALAYHLADPKIFLGEHRIRLLPTEHHSNFPFTMEMLFTIGLAFDGYVAANLFHLLTAILLVLALICFGDRFLSRRAGLIAAVVFLSTPIVLWEATVAYIDLGLALFLFLAFYLMLLGMHSERLAGTAGSGGVDASGYRMMIAAGTLMGFALGIKYLALLPLVFLIALALYHKTPIGRIAVFGAVACAIGSPWYVKNAIWMRNPVYPFAYSVFPGSKYWSADRAAPYSDEQRSFGTAHDLGRPAESLRNLATSPWQLLAHPALYTNRADFTVTSLMGGLYAGFVLSLAGKARKPIVIRDALLVCGAMFVSWFFVSQHVRYLTPALPFGAVLCGYAADHWMRLGRGSPENVASTKRFQIVNMVTAYSAAGAVVGQVCVLGWGITMLPVAGRDAILAYGAGLEPTALSVPEVAAEFQQQGERDRHLRRLASYSAAEWINQHAPERAGVILYEDVHGFYIDRPYLWGNGEHSSYIPYDSFRTGDDLTQWFRERRIRYALFNLNNTPSNPHVQLPDDFASVDAIMKEWYGGKDDKGWRKAVGEAIHSGKWVLRFAHHGVVVLDIGGSGE